MRKNHSTLTLDVGTLRFGNIAITRNYVTRGQVETAMAEQDEDHMTRKPYRSLGMILLENHLITEEQMETILEEMGK